MGRRPQPGGAGSRAARRRPAEHDSAARLDDAHVVPVAAALAASVAASTLASSAVATTVAISTLASSAIAAAVAAAAVTTAASRCLVDGWERVRRCQ